MNEALRYLGYMFEEFIEGFLEDTEIFEGVTIGYILMTVIIMGMFITLAINATQNISFRTREVKKR